MGRFWSIRNRDERPLSARTIDRWHWRKLRLTALMACLLGVLLMGWKEINRRQMDWSSPHQVAIILVERDGVSIDSHLVEQFRKRSEEVEDVLSREMSLYHPVGRKPFEFEVFGPVAESRPPPTAPEDEILSLLRFNWALSRYAERHDASLGLDDEHFDVRIYLRVSTPEQASEQVVEGMGQQLGSIGMVTADFAPSSIDFAWFVAVHELLHTRGATDKYGADGHALYPAGLADPQRRPMYPQAGVELMARGRPVSPGVERPPGVPSSWAIGRWTAAEIEWKPVRRAATAGLQ